MANLTLVLRGQKRISWGSGKVWKPHLVSCPFILACQLAASPTSHSLFTPTYLEPVIESGLFAQVSLLLGRELLEWELPGSLGSWWQGCFCLCLWKPCSEQWIEKFEIRQSSYFYTSELKMGWEVLPKRQPVWEQTGNTFGWELREDGWKECNVLVTEFLSTSCLGSCNHTQGFTGAEHQVSWVIIPAPSLPCQPRARYLTPPSLSFLTSRHVLECFPLRANFWML